MKKLKGNVVSMPIAIAALIILVVVGIYLALLVSAQNRPGLVDEPTPSPTNRNVIQEKTSLGTNETADSSSEVSAKENWQTYTNEEYSFSFKYPANELRIKVDDPDIIEEFLSLQWFNKSDKKIINQIAHRGIHFLVYDNPNQLDLEALFKETYSGKISDLGKVIKIGDKAGIEITNSSFPKEIRYLINKNHYFTIYLDTKKFLPEVGSQPVYIEDEVKIFNQILATFKFTD